MVVSLGAKPTEKPTEPQTEEQTTKTEPTTEMVKKTEIFIKAFNDSQFDLPVINKPVEGGAEGETTSEKVKEGKLEISLIVNHGKQTTYRNEDLPGVIATNYEPGYKQSKNTITVEETGVTDVTFMVTLVYTDANGDEATHLVYTEKNCFTEEVEIPVEVE